MSVAGALAAAIREVRIPEVWIPEVLIPETADCSLCASRRVERGLLTDPSRAKAVVNPIQALLQPQHGGVPAAKHGELPPMPAAEIQHEGAAL